MAWYNRNMNQTAQPESDQNQTASAETTQGTAEPADSTADPATETSTDASSATEPSASTSTPAATVTATDSKGSKQKADPKTVFSFPPAGDQPQQEDPLGGVSLFAGKPRHAAVAGGGHQKRRRQGGVMNQAINGGGGGNHISDEFREELIRTYVQHHIWLNEQVMDALPRPEPDRGMLDGWREYRLRKARIKAEGKRGRRGNYGGGGGYDAGNYGGGGRRGNYGGGGGPAMRGPAGDDGNIFGL